MREGVTGEGLTAEHQEVADVPDTIATMIAAAKALRMKS
jgi:hypothetical protein